MIDTKLLDSTASARMHKKSHLSRESYVSNRAICKPERIAPDSRSEENRA